MARHVTAPSACESANCDFYRDALNAVAQSRIPFLVGGAYAYECYTGVARETKDLDLMVRREDCIPVLNVLEAAGYRVECTFPHWLGKVFSGNAYIDIIFSSGNALADVDDECFAHAVPADVLGIPALLCSPEDLIWSKAFVMERERYDGADIVHLVRACGIRLDWVRLLRRFGAHWPVLLSHLILFEYIYPSERSCIPRWVRDDLIKRQTSGPDSPAQSPRICRGTLFSRHQYRFDIDQLRYTDARLPPWGNMTPEQIALWTAAALDDKPGAHPHSPPGPAQGR